MVDLTKLSDRQLLDLKAAAGDLTKLSDETLHAIRPAQAQGRSDAAANAFAQGATLNTGDEIAAGVRAALPEFSNWMMKGPALQRDESIGGNPTPQTVSTAPDFQGRYDEELAKARGQTRADAEAYPWMTTGANVAGNVASTALALPARAAATGVSLLGNAARFGGTGAALGAAAGFGEGEGGFEDRAGAAVLPAVVGGTLGVAAPFVGAAGRSLMESRAGRALSSGAAENGAIQRLATALQRGKIDPAAAETRLSQLGDSAMLADVDPQFLSLARMANTLPGGTKSHAKDVLEARDRGTGNRLVSAFEGGENPPSTFALEQGMDANRRAVGQEAYGKMAGETLNMSDEMHQLANIPAVRDALVQIEADAAATGTKLQPTEIMHRVKQKLNDTATAAFASGKPINKADMGNLASQWEAAFWKANPSAQAADRSYAQAASLPDYMTAGRNFLHKGPTDKGTESSAPTLADLLMGANSQQQAATRAGTTNAARETALEGTNAARALARRVDQSNPVQAKLGEIYGGERAQGIAQRASAESTFADTSNEILRGSKSMDKAAEVADELNNASIRLSPGGGIQPRLIEKLGSMLSSLVKPNEAVRDQIGRAMLNPDSAESRRILALAAELMKSRAAGSPIRAGLIEGAASQSGAQ